MVAELDLPRLAWESHPHYPQQVLLVRSHDCFREVSRHLIERAASPGSRQAVLASFSWWKSAMRSHERYEESKLYPYLLHRWGLDCEPLEAGHHALAEADSLVRGAADQASLLTALESHHSILMDHLDLEERVVVPALLALTPSGFRGYSEGWLGTLLREVSCFAGEAGCLACRH